MREQILNELAAQGAVEGDALARARGRLAAGDALVATLTRVGIDPEAVLDVAVRVSSMSRVPTKWQRAPAPPDDLKQRAPTFLELGAVPVGTHKGRLCIAYSDPEVATGGVGAGLPEHRALLATEAEVRSLQASVFGQQSQPSGPVAAAGVYKVRDSQRIAAAGLQTDESPRLPSSAIEALDAGIDAGMDAGVDATILDLQAHVPAASDVAATILTPRIGNGLPDTGVYDEDPTLGFEPEERPVERPAPRDRPASADRPPSSDHPPSSDRPASSERAEAHRAPPGRRRRVRGALPSRGEGVRGAFTPQRRPPL